MEMGKGSRMPGKAIEREMFALDGYRCRFCSSRVVVRAARDIFRSALPSAVRWGHTNEDNHFGLATLTATIDHVLSYQRGGTYDRNNLLTPAWPCELDKDWLPKYVQKENAVGIERVLV
jgi:hypothetical protein